MNSIVVAPLLVAIVTNSPGDPGGSRFLSRTYVAAHEDGVKVGLNLTERGFESTVRPTHQGAKAMVSPVKVPYEYSYIPQCRGNVAGGDDTECGMATTLCRISGTGPGPLTTVWRRPSGGDVNAPWQLVGQTCLSPPPAAQAGLSYELIRRAWANTRFARATPATQPVGNHTLVNLPTYVTAGWAAGGYQPGRTRTVTLAGHRVRIRPTLREYEYTFGDGGSIRTRSAGGPYPDGDVQHSYGGPGRYPLRITVAYGGEYAVDNGPWRPIRETIRLRGPVSTLHVHTAASQLIPHDSPGP